MPETVKLSANVNSIPAEGGDIVLILEASIAGLLSTSFTKLNDGTSMGTIDLPKAPIQPFAPDTDFRSFPEGISLLHAHIDARPKIGDPTWDNFPLGQSVTAEVKDASVPCGWVPAKVVISQMPYPGVPISPVPVAPNTKIYSSKKGRK